MYQCFSFKALWGKLLSTFSGKLSQTIAIEILRLVFGSKNGCCSFQTLLELAKGYVNRYMREVALGSLLSIFYLFLLRCQSLGLASRFN